MSGNAPAKRYTGKSRTTRYRIVKRIKNDKELQTLLLQHYKTQDGDSLLLTELISGRNKRTEADATDAPIVPENHTSGATSNEGSVAEESDDDLTEEPEEFDNGGDIEEPAFEESSDDNIDEDDDILHAMDESVRIEGENVKNSVPLYEGSSFSITDFALMFMSLVIQFKLSWAAVSKLLEFINVLLPTGNKVFKSLYLFRKFFYDKNQRPKKYYICSNCKIRLSKNEICDKETCHGHAKDMFVLFSLKNQIATMFEREQFRDLLQHRFSRNKMCNKNVEDIYDSEIYLGHTDYVKNPCNLTGLFFTDGVQVYDSSKTNVWPFAIALNELPFKYRYKSENILLGGLWHGRQGNSHPDFNSFLLPLVDELSDLRQGINIMVKSLGNIVINVKFMLLNSIADAPAKACMFAMKAVTGEFGCLRCLQPGESVAHTEINKATEAGKNSWVYPYSEEVILRTTEDSISHGLQALATGSPKFGVKGVTIFSKIVSDYIRCIFHDVMHGQYLGNCKKLMELWFAAKYRLEKFSLRKNIELIDSRLAKLKPPHFITRPPRSITKKLSSYKASEYKNFMHYYSVPILADVMEKKYFDHYRLFVNGIFILSQDSVSDREVKIARNMLKDFVHDFQLLYGKKHMTSNIHSLLHLADYVEYGGPLWVYSCFMFEDLLGRMVRLTSGTRHAELQILDAFSILKKLPVMINELDEKSDSVKFIKSLATKHYKTNEQIDDFFFTVGKYTKVQIIDNILASALHGMNLEGKHIFKFFRLEVRKVLYVAKSYRQATRNISYCIMYGENFSVGILEYFIKITNCDCSGLCTCPNATSTYAAVLRKCDLDHGNEMCVDNMREITVSDNVEAVDVSELFEVLFLLEVNNKLFCARPINSKENV